MAVTDRVVVHYINRTGIVGAIPLPVPQEREIFLSNFEYQADDRGYNWRANARSAKDDLRVGRLNKYRGVCLAYSKGAVVGTGRDPTELFLAVVEKYGSSSTAVFKIPDCGKKIPLENRWGMVRKDGTRVLPDGVEFV